MFKFKTFPEYRQLDKTDCGPTCLKIISAHYGNYLDLNYLRKISKKNSEGTSFSNLIDAGKLIGLDIVGVKTKFEELKNNVPLPAILHFNDNHFVVVYEANNNHIKISDPQIGLIKYSNQEFQDKFFPKKQLLLLLATPIKDYIQNPLTSNFKKFNYLFSYIRSYKKFRFQLITALIILLVAQIILPFLTQSLVDYGINYEDLDFVYIVAFGQVFLITIILLSKIIREHILLKISLGSTKALLNDFVDKIINLPLSFIKSKSIGDYIQRVNDHDRVQDFLYRNVFSLLYDICSIIIFSSILAFFDIHIFIVFTLSLIVVLSWSYLFLKKQARLDHELFKIESHKQSQAIQYIKNSIEIKLNGSYQRRKYDWKKLQISTFKTESKVLETDQLQYQGGLYIQNICFIIIIVFSIKGVIDGEISLGTMLAIQFIIGSLSLPISKLLGFINEFQKASLSISRITDLMGEKNEKKKNEYIHSIDSTTITVKSLNYSYNLNGKLTLKNLNFSIPKNQITAVVGESGSGKSTLLKLLLKLYIPSSGSIIISDIDLKHIDSTLWQGKCGTVLQDGNLFNDTIERNITESKSNEPINYELLNEVIRLSNLKNFMDDLPLGFSTKIGGSTNILSGGEKQRIMIARALYKNPDYLFLDEATSALDSKNEKNITDNILSISLDRTIVIAAHRLSTIKLAHKIIMLENGEIKEIGSHADLLSKRSSYYKLIKHQL